MGIDGGNIIRNAVSTGIEMSLVETDRDTDDADEEFADKHAQSTPDEKWTTAKFLHGVEGERSRTDVDAVEDQGDQERVGDGTSGLQEWSRIVEDEVDTGPLLHHLERSTQNCAAKIGLLVSQTTLEAVEPAAEPASGRDHLSLILVVGNDLSNFDLNVLRLGWLTTEARE